MDLNSCDQGVEDLRTVTAMADPELEQFKKPLEDCVVCLECDLEQVELREEFTML